jgi:hypothetical protein
VRLSLHADWKINSINYPENKVDADLAHAQIENAAAIFRLVQSKKRSKTLLLTPPSEPLPHTRKNELHYEKNAILLLQ